MPNRGAELSRNCTPVDVSIVSMPFKDLRHPPIQLGILQRCLERADIPARSHSFELMFMDYLHSKTVGCEPLTISHYEQIATQEFGVHLGDWIFKVPPYTESLLDDEEYIAHVRSKGVSDETITAALRMKNLVPEFLEAAADELLAGMPCVVGFSTVFQQNIASLVLAKILKIRNPKLKIAFGGGNCDAQMGQALHECFPWVDFVIRGEGERAFVDVVRDVLEGRPIYPHPGLCYRGADGLSIAVPQKSEPQVPMDEVPTPVYDDYFERLARTPLRSELWPEVAVLFESSRGCWWGAKSHCTFCGLNSSLMAFRSKPASRVAEEILGMAARYHVLDFVAVDDIIDLHHIRDLFALLRASGADLTLFYETKANLTKDQLRAFSAAGVRAIQPGIESLSTPILRLMRKGVTALQNLRLLKWCAEIGIKPAWNLLYGFPGEPPEEYERMCDLVPSIVHFEPPIMMPIELERFSPYFEHPTEFGIEVLGPLPHYRFLYAIAPDALSNLAYDFEYRYLDGRDPRTYTKDLAEAVERWYELKQRTTGSLSYRRGPGFLIVQDRRPGFESADYRFDGIEGKIYLACDAGTTAAEICRQLMGQGESLNPLDIENYLRELVEAKLMYREGNSFLSLAIAASRAEGSSTMPTPEASTSALPVLGSA